MSHSGHAASAAAIPPAWRRLADHSVRLIAEAQASSGAFPAAVTFAPYTFCWFRDGAFIADGMSAAGGHAQAAAFHRWCAQVLRLERPAVDGAVAAARAGTTLPDHAYLPARYALDGSRHEDDWWNFQVDGYGTWLWALERHLRRTGEPAESYAGAIETAVRYLAATGRNTCRDWWEEHRDHRHVATLAGVHAGLRAAVRMGTLDGDVATTASSVAAGAREDIVGRGVRHGRLTKWLDTSDEVDGSLVAVAALYEVVPPDGDLASATVAAVEDQLMSAPGSGVHRYPSDTFFGGGQWPVLACLLAWHHARLGRCGRAAQLLDWVAATADEAGDLPEQTPPLLAPDRLDEWLERWGPSARPLLWSHGMFLAALEAYGLALGAEGDRDLGPDRE
ncbi:MAG TPA: glycoside hydrolase family 15 protein [Nocardioidaceae bacterium]|nr:glycoside hydrolase family 15 protein [Nocardioidaceae bacterium]